MGPFSKTLIVISFSLEELLVVWLAVHAPMERGICAKAVEDKNKSTEVLLLDDLELITVDCQSKDYTSYKCSKDLYSVLITKI